MRAEGDGDGGEEEEEVIPAGHMHRVKKRMSEGTRRVRRKMSSEETRFRGQFIQIAITSRCITRRSMYVSARDTKGRNTRAHATHGKLTLHPNFV